MTVRAQDILLPRSSTEIAQPAMTRHTELATTPRPPRLSDADVEEIRANAAASDTDATKRAYSIAWAHFTEFCSVRGATSLPALPETLAAYLSLATKADGTLYPPGTLALHLSAIKRAHREQMLTPPNEHPLVYRVWRGIRRRRGAFQQGADALTADLLKPVLAALPDDVRGLRDRALLLVGFAGAFRRSELASLRLCDVGIHREGIRLAVVRRKTSAEEVYVHVLHGTAPADALLAWLDLLARARVAISGEVGSLGGGRALWRRTAGRPPRPTNDPLGAASVRLVVQRATGRVPGLKGRWSAHSLRAGYATTAAESGQDIALIKEGGGWRSLATVDRYIRARRDFSVDAPRAKVLAALDDALVDAVNAPL